MSNIGVPLHRIWCRGYARVVLRLSLTASLLQWTLQVQAAPAALGSQATSLSSRGANDSSSSGSGAGNGSFLDSVDVKYILVIIALLLAALIVVVVVVVCRRYCRKAKSGEGSGSGHTELETTSERAQGSAAVQTITDHLPMYCTCSAHCGGQLHLHHDSWPVSGALTVAAYPMGRTPQVTDVPSRAELSLVGQVAGQVTGHVTPSAAVGQPEDGGGGQGSWSAGNTPLSRRFGPLNIECPDPLDTVPVPLRDLFVPRPRSERRMVADKLVVSVARLVDSKGDLLVLDNMGICLQIPPGAVPPGQRQPVSLVLNWDLGDNPEMDNRQSLVSPVVYCGPHGLRLDRPCVLSFKHCAFDRRMVQVMSSQTDLTEQKNWQVMCSADDSSGEVTMTADECQVRLQHFSLFTCVQTPPPGTIGRKWLQVAAFCAPLQRQVHHYQVRVYFLNKTPCALQWAIQNEARFGFRLACPERTFLFHGSGEDLHLTVGYVSRGWVAVRDADEATTTTTATAAESEVHDTVCYHAVWHGKCPHLAFCFKRTCLLPDQPQAARPLQGVTSPTSFPARAQAHVSEINLDLAVFQDSSANNPDRLNLLLTEAPDPYDPHPQHQHHQHHQHQNQGSAAAAHDGPNSPPGFPGNDATPGCEPTRLLPTCERHPISISMPPVTVASGRITGKVVIDARAEAGPNVLVDFDQDPNCPPWPLLVDGGGGGGGGGGGKGGVVYPQELKLRLKVKLDPHCPFGHDWKLLASKVGLDKYIRYLTSSADPTLHVLQYMEMQNMDLHYLHGLLKDMERPDAADDVEDVIGKRKGQHEGQEHPLTSDDAQDDPRDDPPHLRHCNYKTTLRVGREEGHFAPHVQGGGGGGGGGGGVSVNVSKRQQMSSRLDEGQEHSDGT